MSLDLGLTVPGVTSTTLTLAIGQRMASSPWLAVAKDNSLIVHTAQARLYLDTKLNAAGLVGVDLPLYVQLAEAQAKLAALSCTGGVANQTASLDVLPSLGHVSVASLDTSQLNNFGAVPAENKAQIASVLGPLGVLIVSGKASVQIGGAATAWQRVAFSATEIANTTIKTVQTNDIVTGLVSSLITNMNLQVTLLGPRRPVVAAYHDGRQRAGPAGTRARHAGRPAHQPARRPSRRGRRADRRRALRQADAGRLTLISA